MTIDSIKLHYGFGIAEAERAIAAGSYIDIAELAQAERQARQKAHDEPVPQGTILHQGTADRLGAEIYAETAFALDTGMGNDPSLLVSTPTFAQSNFVDDSYRAAYEVEATLDQLTAAFGDAVPLAAIAWSERDERDLAAGDGDGTLMHIAEADRLAAELLARSIQ